MRLCTELEDEFGIAEWYGFTAECLVRLTEVAEKYRINNEAKLVPKL